MSYYLLYIKNALSTLPKVHVITSTNITRREEQASHIYSNLDRSSIINYGRFDPAKDLILPVNSASSIESFGFNTEELAVEGEGVESSATNAEGELVEATPCRYPHNRQLGNRQHNFLVERTLRGRIYQCFYCDQQFTIED